jgi:hypothetical protein
VNPFTVITGTMATKKKRRHGRKPLRGRGIVQQAKATAGKALDVVKEHPKTALAAAGALAAIAGGTHHLMSGSPMPTSLGDNWHVVDIDGVTKTRPMRETIHEGWTRVQPHFPAPQSQSLLGNVTRSATHIPRARSRVGLALREASRTYVRQRNPQPRGAGILRKTVNAIKKNPKKALAAAAAAAAVASGAMMGGASEPIGDGWQVVQGLDEVIPAEY